MSYGFHVYLCVSQVETAELNAPEIVLNIEDLTIKEGDSASLKVKVKGQPVPEITWYHADEPIKTDDVYKVVPGEEGESTLELPEAFPEDSGVYTVKATNEAGTVETTAQLTVTGPCKYWENLG